MLKIKLHRKSEDDETKNHWLKALIFTREGKLYRTVFEQPSERQVGDIEFSIEIARMELQTHAPTENCHGLWGFVDRIIEGELNGDLSYIPQWNVCDAHFKPNQPDGGVQLGEFRLCGTLFEKYSE